MHSKQINHLSKTSPDRTVKPFQKTSNIDKQLQWVVIPQKARSWGRRLAWIRILAWGASDPGFKSQRPHHNNLGPCLNRVYYTKTAVEY
jgi:hypothetical protein